MADSNLFERVGGYLVLRRVHELFYEKVFEHPWLGRFFVDQSREHLANQQTDFMAQVMGGPRRYFGRLPRAAHEHIYITDRVFDLRSELLAEALRESGVEEELAKEWLEKDGHFRKGLTKASISECKKRFTTDVIVAPLRPDERRSA
ncbi:MAG TPA: group 1 truncated hemoglobin [Planctomycetes bacterium]|nr:group 1 truncated hemoglobin [Planctomycetota bacterium]